MNFIEHEKEEHLQACIDAYKDAMHISPSVKIVFDHRITRSALMNKYAAHAYSFMNNAVAPILFGSFEGILGKITYNDITTAIVEYCKDGKESSLDIFMYNPVTQRSMFLQTLQNIRSKSAASDVATLLGKQVYQMILLVQDKHKIPMLDKIRKLVVWYRDNRKRIEEGNPGTFPLSPMRTINEFIRELTMRAVEDYSVYHINSPQWFLFAEHIEEVFHVDMYTTTAFHSGNVPDYDLTIVKASDILKPFQGGITL